MRVIVSTLSELCITPGALIVAFAVMYIPRLGFTWNKPVLEGTGTGVLKKRLNIEVIDPVPRNSGYTRTGRYLTLTTCEPEWGHSHRLIAWVHFDSTQPVEAGKPEALRR